MAMASTSKVVLGSIAFAIFWILAVFPAIPILPIGRTAGSLLGAMLMVIFKVISADQAYDAIDLPILGLLFGTMVVSIYLERADMFKYLGKLLSYKNKGGKDLLIRICLVSAISSALFTNDTTCVVLTEFVLKLSRENNLPPQPFLLALASSANIGSAVTPIGNPQNLVIAVQSGISFGRFVLGIIPAMLLGVLVNIVILLAMYWKLLSQPTDLEEQAATEVVASEDVMSHKFSATMMFNDPLFSYQVLDNLKVNHDLRSLSMSHIEMQKARISLSENDLQRLICSQAEIIRRPFSNAVHNSNCHANGSVNGASTQIGEGKERRKRWGRLFKKTFVYLVTMGMLVALLMGLNMSWTALTAALALVVLDFKDAVPCLEKVSYSLLIFFCGLFITVDGFNKTGIPNTFWNFMEHYSRIDRIQGLLLLCAVILVLSNVASNVPTVLLLGSKIAASAASISPTSQNKAWLILAWVSTVGGNLSLLGSAANLIVCEQVQRAPAGGYTLSFWSHLRFGFPSTLLVTAVGVPLIRG